MPRIPHALAAALQRSVPALLALLLSACGDAPGETTGTGADASRGYVLYQRGACHTCHGPRLTGTMLGPRLVGLEQHWDVDALTEFLIDPQPVVDRTQRLREQRGIYMQRMPSARVAGLSPAEMRELAEWLLSEDRTP